MSWIIDMQRAIDYIEVNMLRNSERCRKLCTGVKRLLQKLFQIVTGFSVSEYIRNRKLSLAGRELALSKNKVINIALKIRLRICPIRSNRVKSRPRSGLNGKLIYIFKKGLGSFPTS